MNARLLALVALLLLPARLLAESRPEPPANEPVPAASDTVWYFFLAGAVLLLLTAVGIFLLARRAERKKE
jgi:drug/metabolite transporter (DMT)-like permease